MSSDKKTFCWVAFFQLSDRRGVWVVVELVSVFRSGSVLFVDFHRVKVKLVLV